MQDDKVTPNGAGRSAPGALRTRNWKSWFEQSVEARTWSALCPLTLFAVNAWVCGRLFHTEYFNQLQSIEGGFFALESYIQRHWPWWDWFPLWYGGMPFPRVYQPALHFAVAVVSAVSGASVPSTYHFLIAVTYALGGVAFYWLAKALLESRAAAFCGALLFSLFSPSTLLLPEVRDDVAGIWNPRRLQALVVYGEGPNVTGLTLAMLALALIHLALQKRTAPATCAAAAALAAVAATSWPATMALLMGLVCYVAALEWKALSRGAPRLIVIGAAAFGFACPFAPPSTIWGTFTQASVMGERLTAGPRRWVALTLLVLLLAATRKLLLRRNTPFALRFPVLYSLLTAFMVLAESRIGIRLLPFPARFHLAMEIPLVLAAAACAKLCAERWPRLRRPAFVMLAVFCVMQTTHCRRYAHSITRRLDITRTIEYQVAEWCDLNLHGERVLATGAISFWTNEFTEAPQMTGLFLQSLTNPVNRIYAYMVTRAGSSSEEAADGSLLWMKAWAVGAVAIGGPNSREYYKDFRFPYRFRGRLPLAWSSGDDYIYRVPERALGLARVVRETDLVTRTPENGLDVAELRRFVAGLEDASLPLATFEWQGSNAARVRGSLKPDQVVSVSVNWDRGWTATANGRPLPVRADGLGLIALTPQCSGPCEIELRWSAGVEPGVVMALFLITSSCCLVWCWRARRETAAGASRARCGSAGPGV